MGPRDHRMDSMSDDAREAAARYLHRRDSSPGPEADSPEEPEAHPSGPPILASAATGTDSAAVIETAIQQAIRSGAFDDLPGAGKPIENLGTHHDPDWWIRRKIEQEDLRGLGPVALTLRVEDREMHDRLDALAREQDVREVLDDFNARVRHARLQLTGGPPVVTALRDVDAEIRQWHERQAERSARAERMKQAAERESTTRHSARWWQRRRRG